MIPQKKRSKEERFLLKLHELASQKGNPEKEIDRYVVGHGLGENTRCVDNIVQVLTKNNFLKKGEENRISLTRLGLQFVLDL